jgi:ATP synthase F1 gamma subunit
MQVRAAGIKEVRDRIGSVKNTKKITEAMKLVAAAKVRRAQEAVVNGRPFSENLVKVGAFSHSISSWRGVYAFAATLVGCICVTIIHR